MTGRNAKHLYEFGPFRLDTEQRLLLRNSEPVRLTQKVFETLLVLVENGGRVVEKDWLMEKLWPNTSVEMANLTQNIFILRRVLGETDGHQFIETVPRRGYRFVASVKEVRDEDSGNNAGITLPVRAELSDEASRAVEFLAVLPFVNGSTDTDAEYLSDGLTESIINNLSQLHELRVLARSTVFRYKEREIDSQKVGRELGVRAVVTGRVLPLGDRLIIRVALTDTVNGRQLWGEQYHRKTSDLLAVQEEIAGEISEKLRIKLTSTEKRSLTKRYTENTEAYHLYLKGRYYWNKYAQKGFKKGIDYFQQAIEVDPTYALAYAGLADSYYRLSNLYLPTREAMSKARAAALRALEIDEEMAEAHAALGLVRMFYDWDWAGAERAFTRAVELSPNYAIAHQRLALYFNLLARFDEAKHELKLALELDPLSLQISQSVALGCFLRGQYERALEQLQKTLEMDENYTPTRYLLGWVYKQMGEPLLAIAEFQRAFALDDSPIFLAALGHAYAVAGQHSVAREALDKLQEQSKSRFVSSYSRAVIHMGLGETDQVFAYLEQAYKERSEMLAWLRVGPELDGFRSDPRFADLLRRVGLPHDYRINPKYAAS